MFLLRNEEMELKKYTGSYTESMQGIFYVPHGFLFFSLYMIAKAYVILEVYFSILLSNIFRSVIYNLIFTQGVISSLLKK